MRLTFLACLLAGAACVETMEAEDPTDSSGAYGTRACVTRPGSGDGQVDPFGEDGAPTWDLESGLACADGLARVDTPEGAAAGSYRAAPGVRVTAGGGGEAAEAYEGPQHQPSVETELGELAGDPSPHPDRETKRDVDLK